MYEIPLSFEEMCDSEEICDYCNWYNYGESKCSSDPNWGCVFCEGSRCKDSYDVYLDNFDLSNEIVSYCNKVKLLNGKEVEEWIKK